MKVSKKQDGFNLIELLVVMAIIAVLVALVIAAINIARRASRDTDRRSTANTIKAALEDYYAREKEYPAGNGLDLEDIQDIDNLDGIEDQADPNGEDARFWYSLGDCEDGSAQTGKYSLFVMMEGEEGDSSAAADCAKGEDFSNR